MSPLEFYSCHKSIKINVNENINYSICYLDIIIYVREIDCRPADRIYP